ncbi:hypothetical protein J7T55_007607 [Diaporthe amygdali]|uniref:uncharacterized protein n=1 Tax=Phomopsis amygdali TaxID=1214568 RepID=UPI0022FDFA4E|nr:uncharacterized protein J7T55_007607 [Diaporthe amygdali]KAJ0107237.1 hypothetical protein J7T55_007607 [Diaporthe amygdali]
MNITYSILMVKNFSQNSIFVALETSLSKLVAYIRGGAVHRTKKFVNILVPYGSTTGSSSGNQSSTNRIVEQPSYLQQQRLDAYIAEPWQNGNRLVALPDKIIVNKASTLPQDLQGVGSWTPLEGGK